MHVALEKARKAAGISGMVKNYPDNPKQRGCGHWAAFMGSVGNDLATMDQVILSLQRDKADLAKRVADLEGKNNSEYQKRVGAGLKALGEHEGWSEEKRRLTLAEVAG